MYEEINIEEDKKKNNCRTVSGIIAIFILLLI